MASLILKSEDTDDPWVKKVTNETAGTSLGLIGGIHLSYNGAYLGFVVPSKYMSLWRFKSMEVIQDKDYDFLDIHLGEKP